MIIPLDKLIAYDKNRYKLPCASMKAVDKLGNIREYPESEEDKNWKIVSNILDLVLNDKIQYHEPEEEAIEESTEESTEESKAE